MPASKTEPGETHSVGVQAAPDNARLRLVAAVGAVVLVLDQITKIWAVAALDDRIIDLFWTARFRLIYNTGSAFSLGEGIGRWLGILIAFVVVGVLWYARTLPDRRARFLLGMIVGGAIGNLIDRIFRADDGFLSGGVVDFIDFQWWPVFNIADIGVVCGAIGLAVLSFFLPEAAGAPMGDADGSDAEGSDVDVSDAEGSDVDDVDSDVAADAEDRKNDVELEASNDGDE
jgi:signal peptidase II